MPFLEEGGSAASMPQRQEQVLIALVHSRTSSHHVLATGFSPKVPTTVHTAFVMLSSLARESVGNILLFSLTTSAIPSGFSFAIEPTCNFKTHRDSEARLQ